jgi:hypothetical protein
MRSDFSIERQAHERHQAHLREAANERLAGEAPRQNTMSHTLRRIAEATAMGGRHRATAAGVMLALARAGGAAIGVGAVVERLTTTDTIAPALVADVHQAAVRPSTPHFGDPSYRALQPESGTSLPHLVDR